MDKQFYIYKITSPSGKVYIGKTVNLKRRMSLYKGLHCKAQRLLYRSLVKYGFENHSFEIVHALPPDAGNAVLSAYEVLYISQYKSCGVDLLNLTDGSEGLLGRKHSEETKKKMRIKSSNRSFPELARAKALEHHTGKKVSQETRRKMSEAAKGKKKSPETVEKFKQRKGEKRTMEARENMSKAHIGKTPWNKGISGYKQPRNK